MFHSSFLWYKVSGKIEPAAIEALHNEKGMDIFIENIIGPFEKGYTLLLIKYLFSAD